VRILWRYVAGEYFRAFLGTLLAVCTIYLVVDYVDRAKAYTGEGWLSAVLELYFYKLVMLVYQLAPAALLLAAGIALSGMLRKGEYTALRALAVGPWHVLAPMAVVSTLLVGAFVRGDELVVGHASRRVDEITVGRFRHFGDWRFFYGDKQWFRGKTYVYQLRDGGPDEGFKRVSLFRLSEDFRLAERIDAAEMHFVGDHHWKLLDGARRTFSGETSKYEPFAEREMWLEEEASSFRLTKGRPEQLPFRELSEQIEARENIGFPSERYLLALHNKVAYPLAGLPGMLLAALLTLRRGRRGHLASALTEGFVIIVALWMLLVVAKAAAIAGTISPVSAAWIPVGVLAVLAVGATRGVAR